MPESIVTGATLVPETIRFLPFDEYDLLTIQTIINSRAGQDTYKALQFYNGDHWQDGDAWIGPQFSEGHKLRDTTLAQIKRSLVSHNSIGEVVDRHVNGVLGRQMHWAFTLKDPIPPVDEVMPTGETVTREGVPSQTQQALIDEAQMALVAWWDKRNVLDTLKHALAGLLCTKRSPVRLSVPPTLRDKSGNLPSTDLEGALDYIYLDHMGFDEDAQEQVLPTATIYTNSVSRQPVGVFSYKEMDAERAEETFVDSAGNTILRIIGKEGDVGQAVALPMGGRLFMYEMVRKNIITPQIMSQQKSLNKTITMKDRNDTQGGFLERILINVKWPTKTQVNSDGSTEEVPDVLYVGPGTTNAFQGASFTDDMGQTHVATPSVQFRDPVPATTFIDSANHTYLGVLRGVNQLHYASTDNDVSGESRKQSRESYVKDLQASADVIEGLTRWMLETVLTLAAIFSGQPNRYESLRAFAQCKIDAGPVSPDDIRVSGEMLDKGIWDWEYAVSQTGVDDVDAMRQRLQIERAENEARMLAFQETQAGQDGQDTANQDQGDQEDDTSQQ